VCPLEGVNKVGFILIDGIWYINWVLKGRLFDSNSKHEDKSIKPIPVPSYLRTALPPTQNEQHDKTHQHRTEPLFLIFHPVIKEIACNRMPPYDDNFQKSSTNSL
jgi:hypothetical protein